MFDVHFCAYLLYSDFWEAITLSNAKNENENRDTLKKEINERKKKKKKCRNVCLVSPDSVKAGLALLREQTKGQLLTVWKCKHLFLSKNNFVLEVIRMPLCIKFCRDDGLRN